MSNGTIRDDALDPFLIKMGLLGNPETMPATHVQQRGMPRTSAASLGISEDIFETFGDIKEMIRKGKRWINAAEAFHNFLWFSN